MYLSVLGDSISSFAGSIPERNRVYYYGNNSGVDKVEQMWWYRVCQQLDYHPLVIEGWSGSTVTKGVRIPLRVPASTKSRCQNLHTKEHEPDLILLAIGSNDYIYSAPLVNEKKDIRCFEGAYRIMVTRILERYPNSKVIAMNPFFFQKGKRVGNVYYNNLGNTKGDYSNIIKIIANEYNLGFIDLSHTFEMDHYYPEYAIDDPLQPIHPNSKGHERIANYIIEELRKIGL